MPGESEAQTWDSLYNNHQMANLLGDWHSLLGGGIYTSQIINLGLATIPGHSKRTHHIWLKAPLLTLSPFTEDLARVQKLDEERGFTLSGRSGFPLLHALKNMHHACLQYVYIYTYLHERFNIGWVYWKSMWAPKTSCLNIPTVLPIIPSPGFFWNLPFSNLT